MQILPTRMRKAMLVEVWHPHISPYLVVLIMDIYDLTSIDIPTMRDLFGWKTR